MQSFYYNQSAKYWVSFIWLSCFWLAEGYASRYLPYSQSAVVEYMKQQCYLNYFALGC